MTFRFAGSVLLAASALACGGRIRGEPAQPCIGSPPTCVQTGDACSPPQSVAASCDIASKAWSCPAGSVQYERTADAPAVCLPFHASSSPVRALGGSLARVPLDDGRCLWVGETVTTADGQQLRNVGFVREPSSAFGDCPTTPLFPGGALASVVTVQGGDDPSLLVQIDGGYRLGGQTRVLYRLFRIDARATFGVTELGSGLGRWDASAERIVVGGPSSLRWSPDLDLGDASLVQSGTAYVWGCHGPVQLFTNVCALARLDDQDAVQLFTGAGAWTSTVSAAAAGTVFDSGPWISSVVPDAGGGLLHVYALGFGTELRTHVASAPQGPWTDGAPLGACDLPGDDGQSFCAGPVVHEEMQDPTRPAEIVVSYGVGTLAADQGVRVAAHPEEYWTRLVWKGR